MTPERTARASRRLPLAACVTALALVPAIAQPLPAGGAASGDPPVQEAGPAGHAEPLPWAAACNECARFETRHVNVPPEAEAAFREAERIWSWHLRSDTPIRIRVTFARLETKAITIPNPISSLQGVLPGDTWYPMALADALAGRDLADRQDDMEIFFSETVPWSFETAGEVPADRIDFLSVAIHEIAHGLGFASLLRFSGGKAFYGLGQGERFPQLSFDVPDLKGTPSAFDRFIETDPGERLMEVRPESARSVALGRAVLEGRLFFGGENAVRRAGGTRPRLLVTDPSHVDPNAGDLGPDDGLMSPKALPGRSNRHPGPVVLGVLEDLGWRIRDGETVAERR